MNEIQSAVTLAENHKGVAMTLGMWLIREAPQVYGWFVDRAFPKLVSIYPYCRDNGGIKGIIKNFFCGQPKPVETIKP